MSCPKCVALSRRSLLVGGGVAAASLTTGMAEARVLPKDMVPLVGPGYRPTDADERGIWQQMDRIEEELQARFPATEILIHLDPEGHTDRETLLPSEITEKAS